MVLEKIKNRIIAPDCTVLLAMMKMDEIKMKILFVYDGDKFEGILTLGDIQRAIIKGHSLSESVLNILDRNKIFGEASDSIDFIKKKMESLMLSVKPVQ